MIAAEDLDRRFNMLARCRLTVAEVSAAWSRLAAALSRPSSRRPHYAPLCPTLDQSGETLERGSEVVSIDFDELRKIRLDGS